MSTSTMMKSDCFLISVILALFSASDAAECEQGWIPYKDELCIKSFNSFVSYNEARDICSAQGDDMSKSTLVMVKDSEMQDLLAKYTHDTYDYLWLGGKYDEESAQFKWEDGEPITYTNWQDGYPRISPDFEACIELRPVNARLATNADGKWADVNCRKRNMVMCQKAPSWSLQDAINELMRIRKQHHDDLELVNSKLETQTKLLQDQLDQTNQDLQSVTSRVVPVGSIYIEYYNQPSPRSLWPTLTWQDVSSSHAGLFFRVYGGESASWGSTQAGCSPRVTAFSLMESSGSKKPYEQSIPLEGWSDYGHVGEHQWIQSGGPPITHESLRFHSQTCEVRPRNMAVRMWRRIA